MSRINGTRGVQRVASRSILLDAIRGAGTISRVDLVRATGLTGATVSTVTRALIDDGLVVEVGHAESTGGKRPTLLALDPTSRYTVGVQLDQGWITYVIANLRGAVVGRWRRRGIGSATPEDVVARVADETRTFVAQVGIDRDRLLGLGVVSPGPSSQLGGMVLTPPAMEAWNAFPLAARLEAVLGLPVLLENDATAAAIGEFWSGASSVSSFAALYMGTGIGAGIMIDGDVYRGTSGNAGEIGHICVDIDGPECWCGNYGCLEAVAGPGAVVAAARSAGLQLPGRGIAEDFASLAREANVQDGIEREIILRSAGHVAVAVQAMANILDIDHLVLTGPGFALAGSLYAPTIRERLERSFIARGSHDIDITISLQAATAAGLGAAAIMLLSEVTPRPTPSWVLTR